MGKSKVILQITHEVKDFKQWKIAFDSQEGVRESAGIEVKGVFVSADNANLVTVLTKAPSIEVARAFTSNPDLKEVMQAAGVISAPEIKILVGQE